MSKLSKQLYFVLIAGLAICVYIVSVKAQTATCEGAGNCTIEVNDGGDSEFETDVQVGTGLMDSIDPWTRRAPISVAGVTNAYFEGSLTGSGSYVELVSRSGSGTPFFPADVSLCKHIEFVICTGDTVIFDLCLESQGTVYEWPPTSIVDYEIPGDNTQYSNQGQKITIKQGSSISMSAN